jgi:hypothetical protein
MQTAMSRSILAPPAGHVAGAPKTGRKGARWTAGAGPGETGRTVSFHVDCMGPVSHGSGERPNTPLVLLAVLAIFLWGRQLNRMSWTIWSNVIGMADVWLTNRVLTRANQAGGASGAQDKILRFLRFLGVHHAQARTFQES